jgi:DNA invertase Pin-like site-specific DNA recombinase
MLIGYARVSKDDQDTGAQVAALKGAGCERIFREKASADDGIGQNSTGCLTNFARTMCL